LIVGKCHEIFASGIFDESVSPQPRSIPLGPLQKFAEIFASQGAPPVSTIPEENFSTTFASIVDTGGSDTSCKFATGVSDTSGKN
jgi:hypothetical protein